MSAFEIEVPTKARIEDIIVLSQKNREPDEDPGAKVSFELHLSNDVLAGFDGSLKSFLFTRNASAPQQPTLEGMAVTDAPNLSGVGAHVKSLKWNVELSGYTLELALGIGGPKSNIKIDDCELTNFRIHPREGGTVLLKFNAESKNVNSVTWAKLAKLKSCEVSMTLKAPVPAQADLRVVS